MASPDHGSSVSGPTLHDSQPEPAVEAPGTFEVMPVLPPSLERPAALSRLEARAARRRSHPLARLRRLALRAVGWNRPAPTRPGGSARG